MDFEKLKHYGKWWLDHGHIYLQYYCVMEILVMGALMFMFREQLQFLYENYRDMEEAVLLVFAAFPTATWAMMKDTWNSMNLNLPKPPTPPSIEE